VFLLAALPQRLRRLEVVLQGRQSLLGELRDIIIALGLGLKLLDVLLVVLNHGRRELLIKRIP
jgi:hypothetical protein